MFGLTVHAQNEHNSIFALVSQSHGSLPQVVERIEKESGLKIRGGVKAIENARFRTLFNNKEFLVFIDRRKFADKRLAEVRLRPARIAQSSSFF